MHRLLRREDPSFRLLAGPVLLDRLVERGGLLLDVAVARRHGDGQPLLGRRRPSPPQCPHQAGVQPVRRDRRHRRGRSGRSLAGCGRQLVPTRRAAERHLGVHVEGTQDDRCHGEQPAGTVPGCGCGVLDHHPGSVSGAPRGSHRSKVVAGIIRRDGSGRATSRSTRVAVSSLAWEVGRAGSSRRGAMRSRPLRSPSSGSAPSPISGTATGCPPPPRHGCSPGRGARRRWRSGGPTPCRCWWRRRCSTRSCTAPRSRPSSTCCHCSSPGTEPPSRAASRWSPSACSPPSGWRR